MIPVPSCASRPQRPRPTHGRRTPAEECTNVHTPTGLPARRGAHQPRRTATGEVAGDVGDEVGRRAGEQAHRAVRGQGHRHEVGHHAARLLVEVRRKRPRLVARVDRHVAVGAAVGRRHVEGDRLGARARHPALAGDGQRDGRASGHRRGGRHPLGDAGVEQPGGHERHEHRGRGRPRRSVPAQQVDDELGGHVGAEADPPGRADRHDHLVRHRATGSEVEVRRRGSTALARVGGDETGQRRARDGDVEGHRPHR